jgi:hypothetical protein
MRVRGWGFRVVRVLRAVVVTAVVVVLVAFALVHVQQRVLRYRAERLLADFHSLQIDRSTWPETQEVIGRWSKWGYAKGDCTRTHCIFIVQIEDTLSMRTATLPEHLTRWMYRPFFRKSLRWLGGREGSMRAEILVDDGRLTGKEISTMVEVRNDGYDYPTVVVVRMQPSLEGMTRSFWYPDEMAQHPNYMIGRPGGCTVCMVGWVDVASSISNKELNRLTSFQLDCYTRRHQCVYPGDLLPTIESQHLYETNEAPVLSLPMCSISPATRARDAKAVVVVDAMSKTAAKRHQGTPDEMTVERDTLHLVATLKDAPEWSAKAKKDVVSFNAESSEERQMGSESPIAGNRYILFLDADGLSYDNLQLGRCASVVDSPSVRSEVMKGIAQDSKLEIPALSWW